MSKKKINLIGLLLILLCSCTINQGVSNNSSFSNIEIGTSYDLNDPLDNLGGGGSGNNTSETGNNNEIVSQPSDIENISDDKLVTELDHVTLINLNNIVSNENYTYENDILTITKEGNYELSGTLNGALVINSIDSTVRIILNNAEILTKDNQSCAAITFNKTPSLRVLTIKDDSTNTLKDSTADDINGEGAIISSKKSSLTINGKGTLNLISNGIRTNAIKVKKTLDIFDTNININTSNNGIKANERIYINNASINVTALNDGIKTDIEATTQEEITTFTSDPYAGYIYIKNSNIEINSKDDGISSNALLLIENEKINLIKITTNNGAPSKVTEQSSNNVSGKALKAGGIKSVIDEVETDLPSLVEDNYRLIINGGKFELNSNDDAITSKGNLIINNGIFNIATGDDALHAEYITKITNGNINITQSYEGIEGASVEIYDGTINLVASDDGINAANADLKNWSNHIYIGGGNILVNAQGDGVDSNGTIEFAGGKTIIYGPTANDNGSLDADNGILVNGGILLAFGSSGMVETPSSNSKQASIVYNANNSLSANTPFYLKNNNGNTLYEVTPLKTYQSIVISTPELIEGDTFIITVGTDTNSITINGILNRIGKTFGPGSGGPGNHGGPGGFNGMPW